MERFEYAIRRVANALVVVMNLEGVLYAYDMGSTE
jgi:hypothetical protein